MRDTQKSQEREWQKKMRVKREYLHYARLMAGGMCSLIGTVVALYVGGWMMLLFPLKETVSAMFLGTLTKKMVVCNAIKCLCSLTVLGAIWCCGYIAKCKIIGYEEV